MPWDGDPVTSDASSITVVCTTTLTLMVTPGSDEVSPGDPVAFDFSLANTGTESAQDATLTATLPAGVEWTADDTTCTIDGTTLTCDAADLDAGASRTVSVSGTLPDEAASCDLDLTVQATGAAYNADPATGSGGTEVVCESDAGITIST